MKRFQKQNNIQESFDTTLIDTDLSKVAFDLVEVSIDSLIRDGTFKDIPVIGTITGLMRFGANIKDKLSLKKIVYFLNELKDISPKERKKMIDQIDNSKKYRVKVGEKLLYIIDNCNDYINSELVARLFKNFIEKKISYDDFLRCSDIVETITNYDLEWFLKNNPNKSYPSYLYVENIPGSLISSGLFDLSSDTIEVKVGATRYGGGSEAEASGGDMVASLSDIGKIIMEIFNPEYKK